MDKYKIAYIDEREEDRADFERYAAEDFEIELLEPTVDINDLVEDIFSGDIDAVITDFNLCEYNATIKYDGLDVVKQILAIRDNFPCFVLTSFDEDAAQHSEDVNVVYVKNEMNDNSGKLPFKERVRLQIMHYRKKLNDAKEEHLYLTELSNKQELDVALESRLIELDNFIEKSLNKSASTPTAFKESHNATKLSELIDSTKELLKHLEDKGLC